MNIKQNIIKAKEFFRWRQNNDDTGFENGDLDRIENQQILIGKIAEKCLKPSIVIKLPKIFNAITSNVNTNMPINKIIGLGLKVKKLNPEDIVMTSIKGYFQDIEGQSFIVSDKEENKEYDVVILIGEDKKDDFKEKQYIRS